MGAIGNAKAVDRLVSIYDTALRHQTEPTADTSESSADWYVLISSVD